MWGFVRLARLPSLPPPVVGPEDEARFAAAADPLLAGEAVEVPRRRLDFLRWLAENRPVVFHGSPRDDLTELSTERRSTRHDRLGQSAGGLRVDGSGVGDLLRLSPP